MMNFKFTLMMALMASLASAFITNSIGKATAALAIMGTAVSALAIPQVEVVERDYGITRTKRSDGYREYDVSRMFKRDDVTALANDTHISIEYRDEHSIVRRSDSGYSCETAKDSPLRRDVEQAALQLTSQTYCQNNNLGQWGSHCTTQKKFGTAAVAVCATDPKNARVRNTCVAENYAVILVARECQQVFPETFPEFVSQGTIHFTGLDFGQKGRWVFFNKRLG